MMLAKVLLYYYKLVTRDAPYHPCTRGRCMHNCVYHKPRKCDRERNRRRFVAPFYCLASNESLMAL